MNSAFQKFNGTTIRTVKQRWYFLVEKKVVHQRFRFCRYLPFPPLFPGEETILSTDRASASAISFRISGESSLARSTSSSAFALLCQVLAGLTVALRAGYQARNGGTLGVDERSENIKVRA
jgi:hypothetical protein